MLTFIFKFNFKIFILPYYVNIGGKNASKIDLGNWKNTHGDGIQIVLESLGIVETLRAFELNSLWFKFQLFSSRL